ncbi:hypothetical protein KO528_12430 [Saccharophagus degradans]|uniref:HzsA-related protein n=1 Tax=Saccharophagus degradans TaxID=86304 RepID=UPI001C0950F7|nr:hypothetical protein [Saccharophagus degradans]MBU2986160.1 hypothetical protein [Saccharophagus degradans]
MNKYWLYTFTSACVLAALGGCDASNGDLQGGSSSGQDPDPVVVDFPIAYVERPLPRDDESGMLLADNVLDPAAFKPGAKLIIKDRAAVAASEIVLTAGVFGSADTDGEEPLYDVKDLETSDDGLKLIFAMRAPADEDADEDEQPTWNIWEYDRETDVLRRIIQSDITAEAGEDVAPYYLPDGRIVFSSTRQRRSKAILLDENKPQFAALTEDREQEAFLLHVMDDDGSNIEQLTFNQSHDLHPTVLDNGQILFLRWDNFDNRGGMDRLSLYTINPDGTNPALAYGYHSQLTGTNNTEGVFNQPRQLQNGKVLVNLRPREFDQLGGDLVEIDIDGYTDLSQAAGSNMGGVGPAQEVATNAPVHTDGTPSPHGFFSSAYPMADNTGRYLVSWSPCVVRGYRFGTYVNASLQLIDVAGDFVNRDGELLAEGQTAITIEEDEVGTFPCNDRTLASTAVVLAEPMYGLWVYDPVISTQSPVDLATPNRMVTEAVIMEPVAPATHLETTLRNQDRAALVEQDVGVVHIHSVYDLDGEDTSPAGIIATADPMQVAPDERPARFLRVLKAVSLPDDDVFDFNLGVADGAGNFRMKDILGYVPVEPDGSAMFKVPADVAVTFSVVNAEGKRISERHQNWFTVRAGEVRQCTGCHARDSEVPHGNAAKDLGSINMGALSSSHFPNTVLLDTLDPMNPLPQLPPNVGETMAAYYARINSSSSSTVDGARTPSVNIYFEDEWTDETTGLTKADIIDFSYNDLNSPAPTTNSACINNWNSLCRVVINYEDHIHPIWEASRMIDRGMGEEDFTCTTCHSAVDEAGLQKLPAGERQLELTGELSQVNNNYMVSYAELFLASPVYELNPETGILQPETEHKQVDGVFVYYARQTIVDEDGNEEVIDIEAPLDTEFELVLDEEGQPIPVIVNTDRTFGRIMVPGRALSSQVFFNTFSQAGATVDHRGVLSGAELKLISEWLDIGAQYYSNPFDAPPD